VAKNILHMLSSMKHMSPFDVNMALDAGFDSVTSYGSVTLDEITPLVQDAMFSRSPRDAARTSLFFGGRKGVWLPGVRFRHTAFAQRRWRSGFRKSISTRSSGLLTMATVLGRDIASRTRCREETSHVLQHIDLADPQS
jgi:hypothetical protein